MYLAHKGDHHRLSFLAQIRAEEFVEEVDYLPRLQWDQLQLPIGKHLILEGHVQAANARINRAEELHKDAPSQRVQRLDVWQKLSMPTYLNEFNFEPYIIASSTLYDRRLDHDSTVNRTQEGVGAILSTRYIDGVYRFLPKIDYRQMFTPSIRARDLPQVDIIDARVARETIDVNLRFLMRGQRDGQKFDIWDFSTYFTAFPNAHRDNEDQYFSLVENRLKVNPHPKFTMDVTSKSDPHPHEY